MTPATHETNSLGREMSPGRRKNACRVREVELAGTKDELIETKNELAEWRNELAGRRDRRQRRRDEPILGPRRAPPTWRWPTDRGRNTPPGRCGI